MGRGGGAGPSDWRYSVPGAQFSFRTGADQEYLTLVSGEIDAITDSIPESHKTIARAPYVLTAPSAGQRPTTGAPFDPRAMTFTASNTEGLSESGNSTDLGGLFNGLGPVNMYIVGSAANSLHQAWWACGVLTANNENSFTGKASNSIPYYRRAADNDTTNDVNWSGAIDASTHIVTTVYDGSQSAMYIDGAGPETAANVRNPDALDVFALGFLDRSSPLLYLSGVIYEVFGCFGVAHSAATEAAVRANLQAEYGL